MQWRSILGVTALVSGLLGAPALAQSGGAWLGVEVGALSPDVASHFGGGVVILGVTPGSPAEQAGLRQGDIILSADGENVGTPQDVADIVHGYQPGGTLELVLVDPSTGDQAQTVDIALAQAPADFNAGNAATGPTPQQGFAPAANLIPVAVVQGQRCRALAPAGWMATDEGADGNTFSLASGDMRMRSSYGVVGINSGSGLIVHPQGGDPATQAMNLAQLVAGEPVGVESQQNFMGAQVFNFRGASEMGYVIYVTYPVPWAPGSYVLSFHIAVGPTPQEEAVAGAIASTIACATQFHPPANGYAQVQPRSDNQATGTSAKCRGGNCDDGDLAGTYNVQLGTGYVHSETTGENFLVDPATDYHETGPDGPGYYRQAGNSYEKLTPGWSD